MTHWEACFGAFGLWGTLWWSAYSVLPSEGNRAHLLRLIGQGLELSRYSHCFGNEGSTAPTHLWWEGFASIAWRCRAYRCELIACLTYRIVQTWCFCCWYGVICESSDAAPSCDFLLQGLGFGFQLIPVKSSFDNWWMTHWFPNSAKIRMTTPLRSQQSPPQFSPGANKHYSSSTILFPTYFSSW